MLCFVDYKKCLYFKRYRHYMSFVRLGWAGEGGVRDWGCICLTRNSRLCDPQSEVGVIYKKISYNGMPNIRC